MDGHHDNRRHGGDAFVPAHPPVSPPPATAMRLQDLRDRIARAEYVVDPSAVAEAILRAGDLRRAILVLPPLGWWLSRRGARSRRGAPAAHLN